MLTITKTPPLVALTGNPIRFTVHSDNLVESEAIQCRISMYFYDKGIADDTIRLTWGAVDITFTCKPDPDNSGTQIPDATIVVDLNDWVQLVSECLLRNYYVNRDWTFVVNGPSIIMYGKESIVGTPVVTFNWTPDADPGLSVYTGIAGGNRIFYKIGLQLLIKNGSTWDLIGEDILPVSATGDATFDIHTLFADYVYSEFTFPERTSVYFMDLRPHSSSEYRIRYYEQYGNPITPGSITQSQSYYALVGGVSKSQEAIYNRQGSSFWDKLTCNLYFLTWQPKDKRVSTGQVEKLFFLAQTAMTRISYRVDFYYLDKTSDLSVAFSAMDVPPDKGVVELTVSPDIVKAASTKPDQIDYYKVWIEYQATRISEIRTYHIDYALCENPRYFLFLNSLGGYDTLRTTGDQEDNLEYDRIPVNKILSVDFTESDHENATGSVS
ncbi:MAG: hypothetical protein NTV01_00970, partial [Bacteroidia bacterium]|nr:hypothetical protein [Bacteroidia bacterium]